jgi:hypothetical protein
MCEGHKIYVKTSSLTEVTPIKVTTATVTTSIFEYIT